MNIRQLAVGVLYFVFCILVMGLRDSNGLESGVVVVSGKAKFELLWSPVATYGVGHDSRA